MITDKLNQFIDRQAFHPDIFGMFVNPFYFARKGLHESISSLADKITGRTLDVGCGQKPYEKLFGSSCYVGLEIDSPENRENKKADFFYDGGRFHFQDGEFDSVVVNEVFEHVFNPAQFLMEIHRVLKSDGMLLMTVPFCWDEHEQPYDFARYSSFGLKATVEQHGFQIVTHIKSMNDIRAIFQMLNAYIYKISVMSISNPYLNLLANLMFIAPFTLLGALLGKILPQNDDFYLDNIILAQKRDVLK